MPQGCWVRTVELEERGWGQGWGAAGGTYQSGLVQDLGVDACSPGHPLHVVRMCCGGREAIRARGLTVVESYGLGRSNMYVGCLQARIVSSLVYVVCGDVVQLRSVQSELVYF